VAFEASNENLTIIQHILIGMNAHISLDLCIAAKRVMDGRPIEDFKNDFMFVNEILASLTDEMQSKVSKVSRLMFLFDWLGGRKDELLIDKSMTKARSKSWRNATEIWKLKGKKLDDSIRSIDEQVKSLNEYLRHPKSIFLRYLFRVIKVFEEKEVKKIINGLRLSEPDDEALLLRQRQAKLPDE
jgi:hypothetical protein